MTTHTTASQADSLRRGPACPSALLLERFLRCDLDPGSDLHARVMTHTEACPYCTRWLSDARLQEARLVERYPAGPFVDDLLARVAQNPPRTRRHGGLHLTWPRLAGGLVTASLATVAVVWLLGQPPHSVGPLEGGTNDIRFKGAATVRVHRKRGSALSVPPKDGTFRSGDVIRFEVAPADNDHVLVLSIHATGQVQCYFPFAGRRSGRVKSQQRQILPGAVQLDANSDELIVVLFSKRPIGVESALMAANNAYARASGKVQQIGPLGLDATERTWLLRKVGPDR